MCSNELNNIIALTIDVERSYPDGEKGVWHYLDILSRFNVKATFFVTVDILTNCFDVVQAINNEEHEIASHGYTHFTAVDEWPRKIPSEIFYLHGNKLREEIKNSYFPFVEKNIPVKGFRAPSFVITKEALAILSEYFIYDSSKGNRHLKQRPYNKKKQSNSLIEIPVSTLRLLGLKLGSPLFLRLGAQSIKFFENSLGFSKPLVFYGHSYDFIEPQLSKLKKSFWKKIWYSAKCGRSAKEFYFDLIEFFVKKNYEFLTCFELAERLNNT